MAGIGVQLNKIFDKETVVTSLYGISFSFTYTIAPMLVVIGCLLAMYKVLGFDEVGYLEREIFSCSILYVFIFSLLTSSPFNSVLSKYLTDRIYERKYEDARPCIYVGVITNLTFSSLLAVPFYIYAIIVGEIPLYYVFTTYMCFLGLTLTFATMIFSSILKQYKKITAYFVYSMVLAFFLSIVFHYVLHFSVTYSMLLALTIGFLFIASLELSAVLHYFPENSRRYRDVFVYFKVYWKLIAANFLYILGLFVHNFVYWTQPWNLVVCNTYVCNQPYDMASFLAMITNVSATILFVSRVEMQFHERYQDYVEAVIGGKLDSIEKTKNRMFRNLFSQILSLAHLQFIISVVIYLVAIIVLPIIGFGGMTMRIYPQLAVGYFICFLMYSAMLFLYYFDDLTGALLNGAIFVTISFVGSIITTKMSPMWYGAGFTVASLAAFTFSYFRLSWVEKNLDYHIFCRGIIIEQVNKDKPEPDIYNVYKNRTTVNNQAKERKEEGYVG